MEGLVFIFLFILTETVQGQSIVSPPVSTAEKIGRTAKFSCEVDYGGYYSTVTWKFNEDIIYHFTKGKGTYPKDTNKYYVTHIDQTFTLEVRDIHYEDGGKYRCQVINSQDYAILIVLGFPIITSNSLKPKKGDLVEYTCKASFGGPNVEDIPTDIYPKLRLFTEHQEFPEKPTNFSEIDFHISKVYEMIVVDSMDKKELQCEIGTTNPKMHATTSALVNVLYSVCNITYSPQRKKYEFGTNLTCEARGNPSPSFEWKEIKAGYLVNGKSLPIVETMEGDNAWKCTARNVIDGKQYQDNINVVFEAAKNTDPTFGQSKIVKVSDPAAIAIISFIVAITAALVVTGWKRVNEIANLFKGEVTKSFYAAAAITIFGNSFPHGWNTGVLNNQQQLIKDFLNESVTTRYGHGPTTYSLQILWAVSVSIYLLTGLFGVLAAAKMGDIFGRKGALLFCHIFGVTSAVLFGFCEMANSFEMLIIARAIVGFGCGAGSRLVQIYLTEISPEKTQNAVLVLNQFGVTCGIVCSQICGIQNLLGNESHWPILLALTAVPCLVSCIVLGPTWIPESPKFLRDKDKTDKAEAAEKFFQKEKTGAEKPLDVETDTDENLKKQDKWSLKELLDKRKAIGPCLIILCSLNVCQQLSGINVVFYYSFSIFEDSGMPENFSQYAVTGIGIINVLMTGISFQMMVNMGQKRLLLIGMAIMIISGILITVALHLQNYQFTIFSSILFVMGFALELGSITQFIGRELFPHGPRTPAISLAGSFNWFANFLVALAFPLLQLATGPNSFTVFIAFLVGFGVYVFVKLPETKGKTHQEIWKEIGIDESVFRKPTDDFPLTLNAGNQGDNQNDGSNNSEQEQVQSDPNDQSQNST